MGKRRYIVHVDMDAFFAAIEQRDNPEYRSKPVIVGSDPKLGKGRGVVSTCSYEARRFGIHSAMPISIAYRKCPKAIFLPVDMEKYQDVSRQIREILYSFTPDVEAVSIDEAFLDISGSYHLFGDPSSPGPGGGHGPAAGTPLETCLKIKYKIKKETGLTASVGLAPTKMAAKIASDLKKPDGMVEVTEEGLLDFLRPLDIRRIWGLGGKAEEALNKIGVKTIGELADRDTKELERLFGRNGLHYWELANGIDERAIEPESAAKSISSETTFSEDTSDEKRIEGALMSLCESVSGRMRGSGVKCKTVTLKIRLEDFKTYTRSLTLAQATNFVDTLYKEIKALYNNFDRAGRRLRLVGVRASNMACGNDRTLFSEKADERQESVHAAIDKITKKFGSDSIRHATMAYFSPKSH